MFCFQCAFEGLVAFRNRTARLIVRMFLLTNIKYDLTKNKLAETTKERRLRCPSSGKEHARVGPRWTWTWIWTWTWSGLGWSGRLNEVERD